MPIRPSDRALAARVLKDSGHEPGKIADLLHVSLSQVYRYLDAQPTAGTPDRSAADDLEALLATQQLDERQRFDAGVARRLAVRLDKVSLSDKAQDAMAMPQIAKELRAVVAAIMDVSQDDKQWLADLSTPLGDTAEPGTPDAGATAS